MEGVAAAMDVDRNCVAVCQDPALKMVAQRTLANRVEGFVETEEEAEDSLTY